MNHIGTDNHTETITMNSVATYACLMRATAQFDQKTRFSRHRWRSMASSHGGNQNTGEHHA